MKKYSVALLILLGLFSCKEDFPVDEDGLLITDRTECFVSNFELLDTDFQTVRTRDAIIDTLAQTIDVEVRWGTNLKKLWPQFTLVTDAKLDPKVTGWTDFSNSPSEWTVISGNRNIRKTYSLQITVQKINP